MDNGSQARERMVALLEARGIRDAAVLAAMRRVPRHLFVPEVARADAYDDRALPIPGGQSISQPHIVALMTEALTHEGPLGRVLEIGTGSGYQAAVLSLLAGQVVSVERRTDLAAAAAARLAALGYRNVHVVEGDGSDGWVEDAPYDGIIVTAGAPHIPEALTDQLAEGGRLVIPVGPHELQILTIVTRRDGRIEQRSGDACVFVPLIGRDAWPNV